MVELVDTRDLKSLDHCGRTGSSPVPGTSFQHPFQEIPARDFFHVTRDDPKQVSSRGKNISLGREKYFPREGDYGMPARHGCGYTGLTACNTPPHISRHTPQIQHTNERKSNGHGMRHQAKGAGEHGDYQIPETRLPCPVGSAKRQDHHVRRTCQARGLPQRTGNRVGSQAQPLCPRRTMP